MITPIFQQYEQKPLLSPKPLSPERQTFKAGENLVYIADLPAHLAHTDVPKSVAYDQLFKLVQRNGNELIFKSGARYATEYRAKALKSTSTGREICFVNYRGARLLLESTRYMQGGSSITQEDLDTLIVYNGQTLREFLKERGKRKGASGNLPSTRSLPD